MTLSDGDGLQLIVKPSGRKAWRFRYTRPDDTKKRNMIHVSQQELPKLVNAIEHYQGNVLVKYGLKLLLLTAVRPGAMARIRL